MRDTAAPAARALATFAASRSQERTAPSSAPSAARARPGETQRDALTLVEVDVTDGTAVKAALGGRHATAVVSCLASRTGAAQDSERIEYAANHHLLAWALAHDATQFTLLSAICVQKPRLAFQYEKLRFEKELIASELEHAIVRPTAFFKSLSGQLERIRAGRPFLVFGQGVLTRCKPIAEADLARYLRRTLEDSTLRGVLPIGGPGPALSPRDQAELLADLLGHPVPLRSVSPALLSIVASVLDVAGTFSQRLRDKAEFARIGHYYATESMLVWDAAAQAYSADQTPEYGAITLRESYAAQLAGEDHQDIGDHAMFS